MSIKVLHVIPAIAPRYGGPSKVVVDIVDALLKHGLEVLIVTTNADGQRRLDVPIGRVVSYRGVPVLFFPRQFSESFKFSFPFTKWLSNNVRYYDVVHIHGVFSYTSMIAGKICRNFGIPYILRPLGSLDPWSLRRNWVIKKILWYLGIRDLIINASCIHFTSLDEKLKAISGVKFLGKVEFDKLKENGVIIPNGINLCKVNHSSEKILLYSKIKPYILFMGRLHPKKALDILIRSFDMVVQDYKFQNWNFVIAGDGDQDYVIKLKHDISRLHSKHKIHLLGWVDEDKKYSIIRESEVLVLLSYQENFGNVILESLACGVPVMVSKNVALSDEIQRNKIGYVVSLDSNEISESLKELLAKESIRKEMGNRGRLLIEEKYIWEKIIPNMIDLYKKIIDTSILNLGLKSYGDSRHKSLSC